MKTLYKKCIVLNGGPNAQQTLAAGLDTVPVERYRSREISIMLDGSRPVLLHKNEHILYDHAIILNRFSRDLQLSGILSELIQNTGGTVINPIGCSYKDAAEKIAQMVRSVTYNIPIPKTIVTESDGYHNNKAIIVKNIHFPLVCKTDGNKGEQVQKIETREDLDSFMSKLEHEQIALIQEYVPNTHDIRIIVAFGKIIGGIKRVAAPNTFLNNVSQGGHVEPHTVTEEEATLVLHAAEVNKTDIAGVDLIYKDDKPLFLELNQGFGIEGFESIHADKPVLTKIGALLKSHIQ